MNLFSNTIFRQLVSRSIRTDYLENLTGFAWLVLQPLLLLAVYSFVFTTIFQQRTPNADGIGFVPFLAIAFWPWTAFSEAILKGSNTVTANAALIGKVAFPSELLPLSMVTASFAMNMAGYLAVLLVLQFSGTEIQWLGVLLSLPILILLWGSACAFTLFTSALQVFVRDLAQILPPLMTFWFFTTPILYSTSHLPAGMAEWLRWNPMTWFVDHLRDFILLGRFELAWMDLLAPALVLAALWMGLKFFRRFAGHFEDFL